MDEQIKIIAGFFSGGATGAIITWFATHKREKANRLRGFRQDIAELRAKVADAKAEELTALSLSTRIAVLVLCARTQPDISNRFIQKFETARADYCDLQQRETERGISLMAFVMEHGTCTQDGKHIQLPPSSDTRSQKQKMLDALQELYDSTK